MPTNYSHMSQESSFELGNSFLIFLWCQRRTKGGQNEKQAKTWSLPMKRGLSTPSVNCFSFLLCVAINNTKEVTVFFQDVHKKFITATRLSFIFTQENTTARPLNSGCQFDEIRSISGQATSVLLVRSYLFSPPLGAGGHWNCTICNVGWDSLGHCSRSRHYGPPWLWCGRCGRWRQARPPCVCQCGWKCCYSHPQQCSKLLIRWQGVW